MLVRRGLQPARAVATEIGRLDASRLDRPIATFGLPSEIAPIVGKLNELLARLSASFARERRFTADVSHELRTPLSALRTTLEVAASQHRPAADYRAAIADATALAIQMQALVANLLLLARLDARQIAVAAEPVDLHRLVEECWRRYEAEAAERRLRFTIQLPADCVVESDPEKLRIVVMNLLSNAAAYTAPGGSITVRGGSGTRCWRSPTAAPRSPTTCCRGSSTASHAAMRRARAAFTAASAWPWSTASARCWAWTPPRTTRPTGASGSRSAARREGALDPAIRHDPDRSRDRVEQLGDPGPNESGPDAHRVQHRRNPPLDVAADDSRRAGSRRRTIARCKISQANADASSTTP